MHDVMLAKCAECLGLRKAFPQELSGFYAPEEMQYGTEQEPAQHQEGSRAAQQQVVEKKLAEMKPQPVPTVAEEPAGLTDIYAAMKDYASTVNTIGQFKKDIIELTGEDREYYNILAHNGGMTHSNDIKGRTKKQLKAAVKALFEFTESLRYVYNAAPPIGTDDSDVPSLFVEQPAADAGYPE
jgi:hypothetical protein